MAVYSVNFASHATLVASTEDEVALATPCGVVTVFNRSGTAEIYFTIQTDSSIASDPTVAGANTALGYQALHSFTTGPVGFEQLGLCTAVGFQALGNATGGAGNSEYQEHARYPAHQRDERSLSARAALAGRRAVSPARSIDELRLELGRRSLAAGSGR